MLSGVCIYIIFFKVYCSTLRMLDVNHSKEQIRNNFNGNLERIFQKFFYNWVFSSEMSASEIMDSYFTSDFFA